MPDSGLRDFPIPHDTARASRVNGCLPILALVASLACAGSSEASTSTPQTPKKAEPPAAEPPMPDGVRYSVNVIIRQTYTACWSYSRVPLSAYRPIFKVQFNVDGSLLSEPKLLDPPSTPSEQHQVDSVLAAFKRCDTLMLPEAFSRYHTQWKEHVLYFGEIGTGLPWKDPLALVVDSRYEPEPTPSMPASVVDDFLRVHITRCWGYAGPGAGGYIPEIKVIFAEDGSIDGPPTLLNPPADPKARRLAADALKAIAACRPVPAPIDFRTLPVRWRERVLRLDPSPSAP